MSLRVIAVNCEGGQQTGDALASLLKSRKPRFSPLVALLCEADGPAGAHDRLQRRLEAHGVRVFRNANGATHGEREVAVAVLGRRFKPGRFRVVNLTPNTNDPHDKRHPFEWFGDGMDRWVAVLEGTCGRKSHLFLSLHAPTHTRDRGQWATNAQATNWKAARAKLAGLLAASAADVKTAGGDLNDEAAAPAPSGSRAWGERRGLKSWAISGVGALLTSGRVKASRAIPISRAVSDHRTAVEIDL